MDGGEGGGALSPLPQLLRGRVGKHHFFFFYLKKRRALKKKLCSLHSESADRVSTRAVRRHNLQIKAKKRGPIFVSYVFVNFHVINISISAAEMMTRWR